MDCYVYAVHYCYYKTSNLLVFVKKKKKKSLDFSCENILFTKYYFVLCVWGENFFTGHFGFFLFTWTSAPSIK